MLKFKTLYNLKIFGGDVDLLSSVLLHDNLAILSLPIENLKKLIKELRNKPENRYLKTLEIAQDLNLFKKVKEEFEIDEHIIKDFYELPIEDRFLVYLLFKVRITSSSLNDRKNKQFKPLYIKELNKFIFRLEKLEKLLTKDSVASQDIHSGFKLLKGKFSSEIMIEHNIFQDYFNSWDLIKNDLAQNIDFRNLEKGKYVVYLCGIGCLKVSSYFFDGW